MIQSFNFASPGRQINAAGYLLRYEQGNAQGQTEALRVRIDGQDCGELLPGDSIRMPRQCSTWEVTPVSAQCVGSVRVGAAEFATTRPAGAVLQREPLFTRVVQHRSFSLSTNRCDDSTAGNQTPNFQLWNPAASGRVMALRQFWSNTDGTHVATAWCVRATAAAASLSTPGVPGLTQRGTPVSKRSGVQASTVGGVVEVRGTSAATAIAMYAPGAGVPLVFAANADGRVVTRFDQPFIVYPGEGLDFFANSLPSGPVGNAFNGLWYRFVEWDEIPLSEL